MDLKNISLEALEENQKEHLEADIVAKIVERFDVDASVALNTYYRSRLSQQINDGTYGIQYLDSAYLFEDLMLNEQGLFEGLT